MKRAIIITDNVSYTTQCLLEAFSNKYDKDTKTPSIYQDFNTWYVNDFEIRIIAFWYMKDNLNDFDYIVDARMDTRNLYKIIWFVPSTCIKLTIQELVEEVMKD